MKRYLSEKSMRQALNRTQEYQKRYIEVDGKLYSVTVDVVVQDLVSGQAMVIKDDAVKEFEICPDCKVIYDEHYPSIDNKERQ